MRRNELRNEALAAIFEEQVRPLISALLGKTISGSLVGPAGFALIFSDGGWLTAYLEEAKVLWKMGDAEAVNSLTDCLNPALPSQAVQLISGDEFDRFREALAYGHGKKITRVSSGIIHGGRYVKFSFEDHGELFTRVGPMLEGMGSYRIWLHLPMKLYWRGQEIGYLLDQDVDMGFWDGIWDSNNSEHARAFERFASGLDPKAVLRDQRLGTLLEWQEVDEEYRGYLVVLGLKEQQLFLHSVIMPESIAWAKKNVTN